jgi:hypothetical protein
MRLLGIRLAHWAALLAAAGSSAACSGTHEPLRDAISAAVQTAPATNEFDIPGVVGLSIDELADRLGPAQPVPASYNGALAMLLAQQDFLSDSAALFRAATLPVIATFNFKTRQVSDLLVLGDDEQQLMQRANLSLNGQRYLILSVFQPRAPGNFLGLRVVAKTLK